MIDIVVKTALVSSVLGEKLSRLALTEDFPAFLKVNLQSEMRIHSGNRRIRKKKAKKALTSLWYWIIVGRAMKPKLNDVSFGRLVFQNFSEGATHSRDRVCGISSDHIYPDELDILGLQYLDEP